MVLDYLGYQMVLVDLMNQEDQVVQVIQKAQLDLVRQHCPVDRPVRLVRMVRADPQDLTIQFHQICLVDPDLLYHLADLRALMVHFHLVHLYHQKAQMDQRTQWHQEVLENRGVLVVQLIQVVLKGPLIQVDQAVLCCLVGLEVLCLRAVPEVQIDLAILEILPLALVVLWVRLVQVPLESQGLLVVQEVQVGHLGLKVLKAQTHPVHLMVLEVLCLLEGLKVRPVQTVQHHQEVRQSQKVQSDLEVQRDPKDRVVQTDQ